MRSRFTGRRGRSGDEHRGRRGRREDAENVEGHEELDDGDLDLDEQIDEVLGVLGEWRGVLQPTLYTRAGPDRAAWSASGVAVSMCGHVERNVTR